MKQGGLRPPKPALVIFPRLRSSLNRVAQWSAASLALAFSPLRFIYVRTRSTLQSPLICSQTEFPDISHQRSALGRDCLPRADPVHPMLHSVSKLYLLLIAAGALITLAWIAALVWAATDLASDVL